MICSECKSEIHQDAKICPHCRSKVKRTPSTGAVLAGVVIFCVLITLAGSYIGRETTKDSQSAPTPNASEVAASAATAAAKRRQDTVTRLSASYCANHKNIRFAKTDWLEAAGLPTFKGVGSFTAAQCEVIIGKLYDLDPDQSRLQAVADAKVSIGMRQEFVFYSWGMPNDGNNTNTALGSSSQYIYGDPLDHAQYVYLQNGVVTATQN